ncbi:MAG: HAD-IA family hydrolase [bacterium]|nr:HAD-IA family hydrolase [bacterium]
MRSLPGNDLQVDAFVFDLDGTLVDSGLDIALSANAVRASRGLAELPVPVVVAYVGDGVARLMERTLGHEARPAGADDVPPGAVAPAVVDEGLAVFADHYGAHLLDNTRPYPGVVETLADLDGVPLLVATNKPRVFADALLAGLGLDGFFVGVVGGDDTPARKPDPRHLAEALAGVEAAPERVVVVGDSPNDILAARAYGARSVGCTYGLVDPARVRAAGPNAVIDAFTDLPALFPDLMERNLL